ncbi:hypothetical protein PYCCODRAFT_1438830 [Trametes coccinea BRFM310]|uniref:AB hydrolase-1 domain-containing protein n=1 Tax=Trametes coccinea (strain BRFM310) TaxID=1353009 RepID=A0A1Y2IE95_TRAC3|nr:hypothetical protein PYCCODRAFT_1438830 [Trametes coccinea BRFM310]
MASTGGLYVFQDSGIPRNSDHYTTLVLTHGYAWHSGIFTKMIPFAEKYNTRIVLLNRRDYPGARPYTDQELAFVQPANAETDEDAREGPWLFMRDRAAELYEWLAIAVKEGTILPVDHHTNIGGVIVAGWSFGAVWMTAFLAHGELASNVHGVNLGNFVRRVVLFDPPYHSLGYPSPAKPWNPLIDPSFSPEEVVVKFAEWVSGYYKHGDTPDDLEYRVPLREPSPTLLRLTSEERAGALCDDPGSPGGSDDLLLKSGLSVGLFDRLRRTAFYLPGDSPRFRDSTETWKDLQVRYIWCDQSVWDMPWGTWALRAELVQEQQKGTPMRRIEIVRLHQANHFVHWDQPERALQVLVCDAANDADAGLGGL